MATTIRVRAQVDEARQLVLTLPPEVQPGEHDIEVTVRDAGAEPPVFEVILPPATRPKVFPPRPTHPALIPEHEAFERTLPELMKLYAGKYVALRGGVVVAVGETEIDVLTAAHRDPPGLPTYTRLVTDQPQPIPRIGSPREVRREG